MSGDTGSFLGMLLVMFISCYIIYDYFLDKSCYRNHVSSVRVTSEKVEYVEIALKMANIAIEKDDHGFFIFQDDMKRLQSMLSVKFEKCGTISALVFYNALQDEHFRKKIRHCSKKQNETLVVLHLVRGSIPPYKSRVEPGNPEFQYSAELLATFGISIQDDSSFQHCISYGKYLCGHYKDLLYGDFKTPIKKGPNYITPHATNKTVRYVHQDITYLKEPLVDEHYLPSLRIKDMYGFDDEILGMLVDSCHMIDTNLLSEKVASIPYPSTSLEDPFDSECPLNQHGMVLVVFDDLNDVRKYPSFMEKLDQLHGEKVNRFPGSFMLRSEERETYTRLLKLPYSSPCRPLPFSLLFAAATSVFGEKFCEFSLKIEMDEETDLYDMNDLLVLFGMTSFYDEDGKDGNIFTANQVKEIRQTLTSPSWHLCESVIDMSTMQNDIEDWYFSNNVLKDNSFPDTFQFVGERMHREDNSFPAVNSIPEMLTSILATGADVTTLSPRGKYQISFQTFSDLQKKGIRLNVARHFIPVYIFEKEYARWRHMNAV